MNNIPENIRIIGVRKETPFKVKSLKKLSFDSKIQVRTNDTTKLKLTVDEIILIQINLR